MVFSSVPAYLDPPNWNQQQAQLQLGGGGGGGAEPHQYPPRSDGMMGTTAVRPASMADRARLAKVPQPEQALNCPRCDSTNTKFCYFNNYSLSQPRHFCKTCRRYWTRGGSLRNVPVGGGCRRNKRIKGSGSSSKSQASGATDGRQSGASSSSSTATTMANPAASHLPFMASLHPLADYTTNNYIGLNFSGLHSMDAGDYHVGGGSGGGLEQWRLQPIQQYPFLGGLEAPSSEPPLLHGLYPFDGEGVTRVDGSGRFSGQINPNPNSTILATSSQGLITQMASVKMEDSSQGLNLSRHYFGLPRNDQYWNGGGGSVGGGGSGGGWMMDLTGFNSTSSGNLL